MAFLHVEDLTFSYPSLDDASNKEHITSKNRNITKKNTCSNKDACSNENAYSNKDNCVLSGINFDVEQGEIVLVCGKSGSGKTTLLRLLKPLIAPAGKFSGIIELDGRTVSSLSNREQSQRIGFVMQSPDSQICTDKVISELAFGLENVGVSREEMRVRIAEVVLFFGMQDILHRQTAELSGGQKQLLNLASVTVMRPDVLILDEPMAQLDPISRDKFLNLLLKMNRELGITILMSEHALDDIAAFADKVVFLDRGRVLYSDTPSNVVKNIFAQGDDCVQLLPTPARIYMSVCKSSDKSTDEAMDEVMGDIPLTVRDARRWLNAFGCRSKEVPQDIIQMKSKRSMDLQPQVCHSDEAQVVEESPVLQAKDLWFRYDRDETDVLRSCSFAAEQGAITALFGGNGSGKSTLLKVLSGQLKPYMGSVKVGHKKPGSHRREIQKRIVYLPQDPTLLFTKNTVGEELSETFDLLKSTEGVLGDLVSSFFKDKEIANQNPFDLSGGQRQLLSFMKIMTSGADIICLDEPTKGMDMALRKSICDALIDQQAKGKTIIIATHDVDFAAQCADFAAMLFDGGITTVQPIHDFLENNFLYTTTSRRISAGILPHAVVAEEVVLACV